MTLTVALLRVLSRLPLPVLYVLGDMLFLVAWYLLRYERRLVEENLKRAFPEKTDGERTRIARDFYRNILSVMMEVVKALAISEQELRRRVKITNPELLEEPLKNGQSSIALAAHHCNWEWLLLASSVQFKGRLDALYKPITRDAFDALLLESRTRFGAHLIPARSAVIEIMKRRDIPRIIALVADQGPRRGEDMYWRTFMHRDTAFFQGTEKIAQMTRLPVYFIGMQRIRRGYYEITLSKLAEPPYDKDHDEVMDRYIDAVEAQIHASPADWLWMYKRWKYEKPLYG